MNMQKTLSRRELLKVSSVPVGLALATGDLPTEGLSSPAAQILSHTMWVHGHSAQVQNPDQVVVEHVGTATRAHNPRTVGVSTWFQFAIPTPVPVDGRKLHVGSVLIHYRASNGPLITPVEIRSIHVYDAGARIATHDNLGLRAVGARTDRFDVPQDPIIRFGLGISVGVYFGGQSSSEPGITRLPTTRGDIAFHAAGCEFLL
jgi:hypothetical protein